VTTLRRLAFPLRLVGSRLGAGGERTLLVAVGVVAGAAVLAAVLAGRLVMQDRALAESTAQLAPADRVVQVTWSGAVDSFARHDRFVAPRVRSLTGQEPARAMLFREASVQGRLVNLRAADDLGRWVRITSGRLPRVCVPQHCEVLRLEGRGPIPSTHALRLIEVGRAVLKPDAPIAPFVLPTPPTEQVARAVRYHTPPPSPVVIANGVQGLSATRELQTFYRAYAWVVDIRGADVHPWTVGEFSHKVQQLTAQVESNAAGEFDVSAPTLQLAAATAASETAAQRLLLLGGEGACLLLAFTILAAGALRRDVTDARRRLIWFGARRWQVELYTLAESLALVTVGTIVGWVAGGAIAATVAGRAGSPAWPVIEHGLLSGRGLLAAGCLAVAAGALLYATVRAQPVQLGRLAFTPLDAAALGAVAIVLTGWARGSVDAQSLSERGGTSAFLLLVPALIVFAAAVAAARLLVPALRGVGRLGRRGPIALRLAAASLARNPGHAAIAATFLVASLGLALFAVSYRSTLLAGQHDEARYTVPASFVLSEDFDQLVPVLHGARLTRYPTTPMQALRLTGNVPSGATFTFLGLPTDEIAGIDGWRADFAQRSLPSLASSVTPPRPSGLRTTALPAGRRFTLPVSASGDDIAVRAIFRSPLGDFEAVGLGHTNGAHTVSLRGRIPFEHATLAQLRFDVLNNGRLSANAGTGIQPSAKGVLSFGRPRVDGRLVPHAFARWTGTGGVGGAPARLGFVLTTDRTGTFRPVQPTDGVALRVLATPGVVAAAGPRGIIPLEIEGEQVAARIVGTVDRFPSVVGDAVVADREAAATLLDTRSGGLGTTDELWLTVPAEQQAATAAALARAPFSELQVSSQAETLARLEADPLARGALLTLAGTAGVALLLALLGLLLAVVGDVRDDRGELFDLEAQGAAPSTVRAHLRLRALLVSVFGILGGLVLGTILSALVISLVSVTAGAAEPEPPLRLVLDLPLLLAAAVAYVALAAALVAIATTTRGAAPARASEAAA
jgi:ABC-type antimicrobial peptide transport system permease subunit